MVKQSILDCTLRDGGYINNWSFGEKQIKEVIKSLINAEIEIIEVGFLTDRFPFCKNKTLYNCVKQIIPFLPQDKGRSKFVAMMNVGEYEVNKLEEFDGHGIDGIRVAFHKDNLDEAISLCKVIKEKGYEVFVQPMVIPSYSEQEILELIDAVNKIEVYAIYIVDSFGFMNEQDVRRMFVLFSRKLNKDIFIGFHSHNNLQLSFSNAQAMVKENETHNILIDSTILGMGRGAGNLNTELFIEYLNSNYEKEYKLIHILKIIDKILYPIYKLNYWGYSVPYYLSAKNKCHPNYATYLTDKNTLNVENISEILSKIPNNIKNNFDNKLAENLYLDFQKHKVDDNETMKVLCRVFNKRKILIIAPGKSIDDNEVAIKEKLKNEKYITVAVNFYPEKYTVDYIFVSNLKRYEELNCKNKQLIVTSNIRKELINSLVVDYENLLIEIEEVKDNAGLMLLNLLSKLDVEEIVIAGLDGYIGNNAANYAKENELFVMPEKIMKAKNNYMHLAIEKLSKKINIEFITPTLYYEDKSVVKVSGILYSKEKL